MFSIHEFPAINNGAIRPYISCFSLCISLILQVAVQEIWQVHLWGMSSHSMSTDWLDTLSNRSIVQMVLKTRTIMKNPVKTLIPNYNQKVSTNQLNCNSNIYLTLIALNTITTTFSEWCLSSLTHCNCEKRRCAPRFSSGGWRLYEAVYVKFVDIIHVLGQVRWPGRFRYK